MLRKDTGYRVHGTDQIGNLAIRQELKLLWHVDPLLDNDREISSYTTAVAK
jgi:hypothetical protein